MLSPVKSWLDMSLPEIRSAQATTASSQLRSCRRQIWKCLLHGIETRPNPNSGELGLTSEKSEDKDCLAERILPYLIVWGCNYLSSKRQFRPIQITHTSRAGPLTVLRKCQLRSNWQAKRISFMRPANENFSRS